MMKDYIDLKVPIKWNLEDIDENAKLAIQSAAVGRRKEIPYVKNLCLPGEYAWKAAVHEALQEYSAIKDHMLAFYIMTHPDQCYNLAVNYPGLTDLIVPDMPEIHNDLGVRLMYALFGFVSKRGEIKQMAKSILETNISELIAVDEKKTEGKKSEAKRASKTVRPKQGGVSGSVDAADSDFPEALTNVATDTHASQRPLKRQRTQDATEVSVEQPAEHLETSDNFDRHYDVPSSSQQKQKLRLAGPLTDHLGKDA